MTISTMYKRNFDEWRNLCMQQAVRYYVLIGLQMTDELISFETLGLVRQPLGLLVYYI